ncbi:MAG TPA: hypothetical protein VKR06_46055 [Ktedonosporobacter sp.]|nr:hypothetical protein [Ktedonosporobacter sp.]
MDKTGQEIHFTSPEHKALFVAVMQQIGKVYAGKFDPEYGAALYVLTAKLSTWEKAESYVSRHGIDFEGLLAEVDFSGGYQVLVQWAGNLFNSQQHIDPIELLRLDERNFELALAALKIRRYGLRMDALQSE